MTRSRSGGHRGSGRSAQAPRTSPQRCPVIDDTGKVVGFLSEKDCLKAALNASYYEERGGPVSQFMSRNIKTITASSPLTDVIELS